MKSKESKGQKNYPGWLRRGHIAWNALRGIFQRRPLVDEGPVEDARHEPSKPPISPLDRIQEALHRHGLGQQVHVRWETAGDGFVLEDADGFVHAKDYATAVAMIERIWLYQP